MKTDLAAVLLTMSTLEIAGLTGERHDHVLRDADKMLNDLGIGESKFGSSYITVQNKEVRLLNLPKRECRRPASSSSPRTAAERA